MRILHAFLLLLFVSSCAHGDAGLPDIHELVTDADHIVVATIQDIEKEELAKAKIEVAQWIKTQFKTPPKEYTIYAWLGEDSPFEGLKSGTQYVIFIFDKNQVRRPGGAIKIVKKGTLSSYMMLGLTDPSPQTVDEMVALIELIMSDAYEERLIGQIEDLELEGNQRARAARSLGYLKSTKAFPILLKWAKSDDPHNSSTTSAAMWSLSRIDSGKATPIFVEIAATSVVRHKSLDISLRVCHDCPL